MKNFAIYEFPFGFLKIEYKNNVVVSLIKVEMMTEDQKNNFTDNVYSEIMEYLGGKRKTFSFECELIGTEFQKKVWRELANIPYGETRAYKQIAEAIGNEKAYRAVGSANNKNPIFIVYPCHRVIGTNGKLVGYAGGLDMKEALLRLEKENNDKD